jgi:magnesium transporter
VEASGCRAHLPRVDEVQPAQSPRLDSMPVVDNAIYRGGLRVASPATLEETFEALAEHGGFAWIGLYRPTHEELDSLAREFGLHHLAIEDARKGHQRAKLERSGDTLFVVLRPARYLDDVERVEFGELHVFIGHNFAITIRHAESPDLARVRRRLEASPELLAKGQEAVLYAVLDEVVDEYSPVLAGLENDIDEIEEQLFSGDPAVTRRIYDLASEVMEFQRATRPLEDMIAALQRGFEKYGVDAELQHYLRDVLDHSIRITERGESFRQVLQNALQVHTTLVAQRQNEEMRLLSETNLAQSEEVKKISSWAAIIFAPTLIGTVYGMNFTYMPELEWRWGYPIALALMAGFALALYGIFKRRGWL